MIKKRSIAVDKMPTAEGKKTPQQIKTPTKNQRTQ